MPPQLLKPSRPIGRISDHIGRHFISIHCQACQRVVTHDPLELIAEVGDMPCAELMQRSKCGRCGLKVASMTISGGDGMAGMAKPRQPGAQNA